MKNIIHQIFLIITLSNIQLEASSLAENKEDPSWEDAFLINLNTCSGTLIHPDWVITAAHCIDNYYDLAISKTNLENGDVEFNYEKGDLVYPVKIHGYSGPSSDIWTTPLKSRQKNITANKYFIEWRTTIKVICHSGFLSEALSWKGNDFCLLKLSPIWNSKPNGDIVPACLPSENFDDIKRDDVYYTAGYGRRNMNFCLTDIRGPEKFAICGSSDFCRSPRSPMCRLHFSYENKYHKKCLKDIPNPSLKDPRCRELFHQFSNTRSTPHHIFGPNGTYISTCYPNIKGAGWCGTHDFGEFSSQEPNSESGWGYCSDDEVYRSCNSNRQSPIRGYDTKPIKVQLLHPSVCESKLGDNLRVEQPKVRKEDYSPSLEKYSIFCAGRLHEYSYKDDAFFQFNSNGKFSQVEPSGKNVEQLLLNKKFQKKYLNGGPNCFGDSGGPLWKYSRIAESGKVGPVLVGVFSFMLWGTCHGRQEPPFFGRVKDRIDWIYLYIPKDEICHG